MDSLMWLFATNGPTSGSFEEIMEMPPAKLITIIAAAVIFRVLWYFFWSKFEKSKEERNG